eukprot:COSAG02_NODE_8427_length_2573_cov_11.247373_3_plen_155_part_00
MLTLHTRPLIVLSNAGGSGVLHAQHTAGFSNYQRGNASPTDQLALRAFTARTSTRLEWSASACDPFSLAERTWTWLDPSRRKWQTKYSLIWLPRHWRESFPTVTRTNQSRSSGSPLSASGQVITGCIHQYSTSRNAPVVRSFFWTLCNAKPCRR